MAVSDRTFSFRAPAGLAQRLEHAQQAFHELVSDAELADHLAHEFEIELYRRLRRAGVELAPNAFVRAVAEAFVAAVERAHRERELAEDLRAFAAADREGDAWRGAAAAAWFQRD